jgi:predicted ArsR family transcriptional regulator
MPRVLAGYRGEYKAAPPKKPEPQGAPKRHSENALTLAFLRENPGATAADIASHFQVTPEGAWKRLARLAYRKWVRHEGERGERRYWITEGAP